MRYLGLTAFALLLSLGGCGDDNPPTQPVADTPPAEAPTGDPVAAPTPEAQPAPPAPTAVTPRPTPADAPEEPPKKGGDEEFVPPQNWCGTPTVGRRPPPPLKPMQIVILSNKEGHRIQMPAKELTPKKLKELQAKGYEVVMRLSVPGWKREIEIEPK